MNPFALTTPQANLAFPAGSDLHQFLDLAHETNLEDLLKKSLTDPLTDFLSRPRKSIRDHIVQLGFSLGIQKNQDPLFFEQRENICQACCAILEIFHAGSLVVDDIEDGSQYRRGGRTLHQIYGIPLALNAGNWLYFLPFKLIQDMPIAKENQFQLIRVCHETLLRAHYGQALDLGIPVDTLEQSRVPETSLAAMELKSGVLTGLAFKIGAVASGADAETVALLDRAGRKIGVALQMLDDLGSLTSKKNPEKKCEDLKLKRLGYVFSAAAELLSPNDYKLFLKDLQNCDEKLDEILNFLADRQVIVRARKQAQTYLSDTIQNLKNHFQFSEKEEILLHSIQTCLVNSYE